MTVLDFFWIIDAACRVLSKDSILTGRAIEASEGRTRGTCHYRPKG